MEISRAGISSRDSDSGLPLIELHFHPTYIYRRNIIFPEFANTYHQIDSCHFILNAFRKLYLESRSEYVSPAYLFSKPYIYKMKILIVCLGNICRSPMAEGILRDKAEARGIKIKIDSAGTSAHHIGEAPDKRARKTMKSKGHDISRLRARQFEPLDYDRYDKIFVMDSSNLSNVLHIPHSPNHRKKVQLMMDLCAPGEKCDVPDPYFGGDDGFENVYQMLDEACEKLLDSINGQS